MILSFSLGNPCLKHMAQPSSDCLFASCLRGASLTLYLAKTVGCEVLCVGGFFSLSSVKAISILMT